MARSVAAPLTDSPARALLVLWRFSRPHTIVGTFLSIGCIYAIAAAHGAATGTADLLATLVAGAAVNLFIVGLNQVTDVEIDRINKPWLPIAAGDLSLARARIVVAVCAVLSIGMAVSQGVHETVAVAAGLGIGAAYSAPPLRLKRHPAIAAASITFVRSLVVNLGVWLHFVPEGPIAPAVLALTLFVVPFSFAIAVLKDVPDIEGDRRHRIATFSVRLGPRRVLGMGMAALTAAYAGMALLGPLLVGDAQPVVLTAGHAAALGLLWTWASRLDVRDRTAFTAFYMRVWTLFFAEYLLVALAVALE